MFQVEAARSFGIIYHVSPLLCLCMRVCTWWPPAQTRHQIVTVGDLSQGPNCFGGLFASGGILYLEHFVSGGFGPRWIFDCGAYGLVALDQGLFAEGF